jgi:hypothetical protein
MAGASATDNIVSKMPSNGAPGGRIPFNVRLWHICEIHRLSQLVCNTLQSGHVEALQALVRPRSFVLQVPDTCLAEVRLTHDLWHCLASLLRSKAPRRHLYLSPRVGSSFA